MLGRHAPHPRRSRSVTAAAGLSALVAVGAVLVVTGCGRNDRSTASTVSASPDSTAASAGQPTTTEAGSPSALPPIDSFRTAPSDRLPVDTTLIRAGHPFKGKNAVTPHTGAHIHFGTDYEEWPQGGDQPQNYPPIYAVADGVVSRVTKSFPVGDNDRYGVNLAIASSGTAPIEFEYSIEPMVKEPSPGFYATFITVKEGDRVKKGDVIAYMYLPKGSDGAHIHFELINTATGEFMAPAIFTKDTVWAFYGTWKMFGFDSAQGYDNPIPPCMGWKLDASENPFENRAVDCLADPSTTN